MMYNLLREEPEFLSKLHTDANAIARLINMEWRSPENAADTVQAKVTTGGREGDGDGARNGYPWFFSSVTN